MTLLRPLVATSDALNRVVTWICVLFLGVMLAISFLGSFYMVATGDALSWTYSLARLFVPWIGLLSITVAFKRGEHVAMSVLVRQLPERAVTWIAYFNVAVIAAVSVLLVWYGWEFFLNSTQYYMVSDQLQVHHRWVAAAVPVTGLILLLHVPCGIELLEAPEVGDADEYASNPEGPAR